jgi:hypothetical protein
VDRASARGRVDHAMNRPACPLVVAVLVAVPLAVAQAQTLNGSAEWTAVRGDTVSDDQASVNNSFWQRYTAGYSAPFLDPRLLRYDTEISFRTNDLTYGGDQNVRSGRQSTVGYRVNANAFPARPFPFYIQATRDTIGETGDYPTTNAIRGGIVVPPDTPPPHFQTLNKVFNAGWQLTVPSLPRVELSYHTGSTNITGGPFTADQNDGAMQVGVFKDTTRIRQAFRYNRSSFENLLVNVFDQRLSDLDYEFDMTMGRRSHFLTHAGRRTSFSMFDLPPRLVDPGTEPYRPPARGDVSNLYVTSGVTYDPSNRLSLSVTGNADRQDALPVATSARLATTTARYDVGRGLSVSTAATYGERGQVFQEVPVTVMTRSGQVGATYRAGVRWLEGMIDVARGTGANTTPDGREGSLGSWSRQATLTSSIGTFGLSASVERQHSQDEILDYGNFDSDRVLGSFLANGRLLSTSGSWEHLNVRRGRGETLAIGRQETFSATLSVRIGRESSIGAETGGFTNRADIGLDRTLFWGGRYESHPYPRVHLAASLRREETVATQARLQQRGVRGFGQAEYRLRLFSFALEYRDDDHRVHYGFAPNPSAFRGRQVQLRITRTFGVRL